MSYPAEGCHGTVTVGDLILFDNNGGGDVLKLEFMYQPGDVVTVTEEGTCIVDVYELKVASSDWEIESMFGRGGIDSVEKLTAAGWVRTQQTLSPLPFISTYKLNDDVEQIVDRVDMGRATAQHSGFWCSSECNGV